MKFSQLCKCTSVVQNRAVKLTSTLILSFLRRVTSGSFRFTQTTQSTGIYDGRVGVWCDCMSHLGLLDIDDKHALHWLHRLIKSQHITFAALVSPAVIYGLGFPPEWAFRAPAVVSHVWFTVKSCWTTLQFTVTLQ